MAGLTVLPQTLNPYPYGVNNPLVYTDPSGEFAPLLLAAPVAAYLAKNALQSAVFSGAEYYLTSRGEKGGFDSGEFARVVGGDTLTGSINPFAGVGKAGKIAKVVGKGGSSLDDLSRSVGRIDPADATGTFTKAGRALQKYGSRPGSAFPAPKGNPNAINRIGQDVVDDILTAPGSRVATRNTGRYGEVIEVRAPDGRGVRFDKDGDMIGFLQP